MASTVVLSHNTLALVTDTSEHFLGCPLLRTIQMISCSVTGQKNIIICLPTELVEWLSAQPRCNI